MPNKQYSRKDIPGGSTFVGSGGAAFFEQSQRIFSRRRRSGFTLIEVLIYGFIFGAFLMLITQLFLTIKSTTANSLAINNLQQNYARIFSDLSQTIRSAENVILPAPGGAGAVLSLNDGQVVYQLNSGYLQKNTGASTYDLNDGGLRITAISFENPVEATQTPVIKIDFSVESNYFLQSGKKLVEDFQMTVGLR